LPKSPLFPNHGSGDATILGNFNRLNPPQRLAHHGNFAAIEAPVILAGGAIISLRWPIGLHRSSGMDESLLAVNREEVP